MKKVFCVIAVSVIEIILVAFIGCGRKIEEDYSKDVLLKDAVIDLGNHKVAYLEMCEKFSNEYEEYLVIHDLDNGTILYIPNIYGEILDIKIVNEPDIYIKYFDNEKIEEVNITNCISSIKSLEMISATEKIVNDVQLAGGITPTEVWSEFAIVDDMSYEIIFERISVPYKILSDSYGALADYKLIVKNDEENVICEQLISNYPMQYEEVHWLINISEDNFPDIILCLDYISQPNRDTKLCFFIWDEQQKRYELKEFDEDYMQNPVWNKKLSTIMFFKFGINKWVNDMKMYSFTEGDWEVYAELIADTKENSTSVFQDEYEEERYYKELDYYRKEKFYTDGKLVKERITDEANWWDENSIWYIDDLQNIPLIPDGKWKLTDEVLNNDEIVWKYVLAD